MYCLATVIVDSTVDKKWKKNGLKEISFFKNPFRLIDDVYVCKKVLHLLPLIKHSDIEVTMSGLPISHPDD